MRSERPFVLVVKKVEVKAHYPVRCSGCDADIGKYEHSSSPRGSYGEGRVYNPGSPQWGPALGSVLPLPPRSEVIAFVCQSLKSVSNVVPKATCLRLAYQRLRICAGCGATPDIVSDSELRWYTRHGYGTEPGTVCTSCQKGLKELEERRQLASDRQWFLLNVRETLGWIRKNSYNAADLSADAMLHLAKACAGPGSRWVERAGGMARKIPTIPTGTTLPANFSETAQSYPAVELSADQREALDAFLHTLILAIEVTRNEAYRRGTSAIEQLARGDITMQQFNEMALER